MGTRREPACEGILGESCRNEGKQGLDGSGKARQNGRGLQLKKKGRGGEDSILAPHTSFKTLHTSKLSTPKDVFPPRRTHDSGEGAEIIKKEKKESPPKKSKIIMGTGKRSSNAQGRGKLTRKNALRKKKGIRHSMVNCEKLKRLGGIAKRGFSRKIP